MVIRNISLCALLCACHPSSHWEVDRIHAFSKLSYPSTDRLRGIDVDFVENAGVVHVELTVHSAPVPATKEDAHASLVLLQHVQEKSPCLAYRFQGGHRFRLPVEESTKIIKWLQSKEEITILLKGYRTVLHPEDFAQKYERFLHPSSLRNPFQLSL